jgi:hypothetical protein
VCGFDCCHCLSQFYELFVLSLFVDVVLDVGTLTILSDCSVDVRSLGWCVIRCLYLENTLFELPMHHNWLCGGISKVRLWQKKPGKSFVILVQLCQGVENDPLLEKNYEIDRENSGDTAMLCTLLKLLHNRN